MTNNGLDIIDDLFIKRKAFIATIGSLGAIISGMLIYFSVWGVIEMVLFTNNPVLKNFNPEDNLEVAHSMANVQVMLYASLAITILVSTGILISSIGLLRYKNWARKVFLVVCWLLILVGLALILFFIVSSTQMLNQIEPVASTPEFDSMTKYMNFMLRVKYASYAVFLAMVLVALFRITRRFRQEEYRRLFY